MNNFDNTDVEKIFIKGENQINGSVTISGAKNAALPLMALSLIINKGFRLSNIPNLADTRLMAKLLADLGITINWQNDIINFDGNPQKDEA